jgi:glutathione S-transferase
VTLQFFGHPFSSYTQKALIALYEKNLAFDWRPLDPEHPDNGAAFARLWPIAKFPLLVDGDRTIVEATAIIDYLDAAHPEPARLIPVDALEAIEVRMLDRVFDNYVMTPMQAIVGDALRPADARDPFGVERARALLDTSYAWLDARVAERGWAAADGFTLADCAAAPALFYADWAHPIPERFGSLRAYRARLLLRPSFARCVDEARQYRPLFPLGAPDRD